MFTLTTNSLLAIAHAQYHVTYLQGFDINHIFESSDPYLSIHFATFVVLRCRLTSVIDKNSVQPMLKAVAALAIDMVGPTTRPGSQKSEISGVHSLAVLKGHRECLKCGKTPSWGLKNPTSALGPLGLQPFGPRSLPPRICFPKSAYVVN